MTTEGTEEDLAEEDTIIKNQIITLHQRKPQQSQLTLMPWSLTQYSAEKNETTECPKDFALTAKNKDTLPGIVSRRKGNSEIIEPSTKLKKETKLEKLAKENKSEG